MKINVAKEGKGERLCQLNDYTTVHWKGYKDDQLVEDSRQFLTASPQTFKLGHFEVAKCWDMAIQQMKPSEVASFECPHALNQEANPEMENMFGNAYAQGTEKSPMKYEIEVMNCALEPPSKEEQALLQKLNPDQCFYIVNNVDNLALSANAEDRFAPRKTGVFEVEMTPFKGMDSNNKAQQWTYSPKEKTVRSMIHKDSALFEGYNQNVIVSQNLVSDNQKFSYDFLQGQWNNLVSGRVLEVNKKEHTVGSTKKR